MEEDRHQQTATGPPDMPPSYEESNRGVGAGGFVQGQAPPPGPSAMYPPLPPDQVHKGGHIPPPQHQQALPVVTQVQYLPQPVFGFRPIDMVCPHCQHNITTATDGEPSAMAWIIGGVLCALQFYCCMCIPCCIDSLQTVTHKCPNCNKFLGRYKGGGI
jgi:lipopolysaccharide-induced tumor necrosis factor-alpha factor